GDRGREFLRGFHLRLHDTPRRLSRDRQIRCAHDAELRHVTGLNVPDRRHGAQCASEALLPFRHSFPNGERERQHGSGESRGVSYFLRLNGECGSNCRDETIPVSGFFPKTLAASRGEFVELGLTIVFGGAPVCLEESLTHEAEEPGIERALFNEQRVSGHLPDAQKNAVAVQGSERYGSKNEEIESTRKNLSLVCHLSP